MLKLSLIQLRRTQDKEENLRRVFHLVKGLDADVILLPENWVGPEVVSFDRFLSLAQSVLAVLPGGALFAAGAQYVEKNGRVASRGVFMRHGSDEFICYEKLLPSQAIGERDHIQPGKFLPLVEHAGWKIGAVACVDLFYPEIVRRLALDGCQLLLNPASIPAVRMPLWQALGLTRAAENTIFVAMANNTGSAYPDGREIAGGSFTALPDGRLGVIAGREEQVVTVNLEQELISRTRDRWPYLEDVRRMLASEQTSLWR